MANARSLARYTDLLVRAGMLDELQLKAVTSHVTKWGGAVTQAIAHLGIADEDAAVETLARGLRLPVMHLGNLLKDNAALRALGVDFCDEHCVFPVSLKDRVLTLAVPDPGDVKAIDEAGQKARARVSVAMASVSEIRAAISRHYRGQEVSLPQRRAMREEPADDPVLSQREAMLEPQADDGFGAAELQRLEAARLNQQKVATILRAVQQLLEDKGLLRK
jgi:type IV pilus assembly protein PilB